MSIRSMSKFAGMCLQCGQFHEPDGPHLYDYLKTVDYDLICELCHQPLVEPMDSKCGHTFCVHCIHKHIRFHKACPVDRSPLTTLDVQVSSSVLRRLLDKLLVVCPNVDYCEEVLPRCDLEAHLASRCKGAVTKCLRANLGCSFHGPRSALSSHLWECPFRDVLPGSEMLPRLPVVEGDVTTIDIQRGCYDLGISIVGGCDTPLVCVVIQEVFPDGVVAKDNRLLPGDQVLEVNGIDLTQATHTEAKQALRQTYPICRLMVFREKAEDNTSLEKEEILKISLPKIPGKQLGIKLVSKKNEAGLFILEIIPGSTAALDKRLCRDDRILEINCQDMTSGTQDQAAKLIQASVDCVQLVLARRDRPLSPKPPVSPPGHHSLLTNGTSNGLPPACKERSINVPKDPSESLGISVAGGLGNPRGDVPVYITNIQPAGCLGRSKQVKKGDVILSINSTSLLDLTHTEAVAVLKRAAESKTVTIKLLEGTETLEGIHNFSPSWKYWLSMPLMCQVVHTITLERTLSGTLGFSIVGGCDSFHGDHPIYVKSVVPNTPAGRDGRLRSGDLLLSVNGRSLENMRHAVAVTTLKNAHGPTVSLRVVSWPGTLV